MSLPNQFKKQLESFSLQKNQKILLAVSGGIDSMVLLRLFSESEYSFGVAHCNFQLREDAINDEKLVKKTANRLSIPFHVKQFETKLYAEKGISTQMAARELRYSWFKQLMKTYGYHKLATAHHLNDSLETVLLNLTKGTGIRGLSGIPNQTDEIVRPLAFATRQQIETFAKKNNISFLEDSSNQSTDYQRNLIRHKVIPVLKEINPNIEHTFSQTQQNLQFAENQFSIRIQKLKNKLIHDSPNGKVIYLKQLFGQPHGKQVFYELIHRFGFTSDQSNDIYQNLIKAGSGAEFLPSAGEEDENKYKLVKDRERLFIVMIKEENSKTISVTTNTQKIKLGTSLFSQTFLQEPEEFEPDNNVIQVDKNALHYPLVLRKWMPGDYFYPFGLNKKQKLKKFFINEKIAVPEKENIWLLCSDQKIVWVAGHRMDHRFRVKPTTSAVVRFRINR